MVLSCHYISVTILSVVSENAKWVLMGRLMCIELFETLQLHFYCPLNCIGGPSAQELPGWRSCGSFATLSQPERWHFCSLGFRCLPCSVSHSLVPLCLSPLPFPLSVYQGQSQSESRARVRPSEGAEWPLPLGMVQVSSHLHYPFVLVSVQ